ncbi:nucleotide diphosphatase/phosphodiesterase NPP2 [Kluyveromyces lactis]|uniref:KLLA0A11374p n=1 Tax=Kluyveromyces lactis (strain ATCC 8585 / CBS 2359 / DSM 70799 / NBRC 1267 / NRRL Y-1140 / WM37) TaxID=284590 RepID=Q6CX45_KLULA|nr:uncharacterized protein KLLA0_A11374g [Kluyveromyces lactis]CAH03082.1 KLLA0A11374p [Kluyveromyces lactis]|eukprot:XP_451494.1 uncharacterized protein KLLA0_A11374g [Kluyveromyces lactis]
MPTADSEFELEFSDLEDPLDFLDSPTWSQRLKSYVNRSKNYLKKWYYVTPFNTGIELQTWNGTELQDDDDNDHIFDNIGVVRAKKKTYIWKWITFVLSIIATLLLSILVISSLKHKQKKLTHSAAKLEPGSTSFKTLVISLDGFHPGYISELRTPFLNQLFTPSNQINDTLVAPYMIPSFPSQTFPNHWTMITGQFPHHHGIIANRFWDSKNDVEFQINDISSRMNTFWNQSYPLWFFTNEIHLNTHTHMWPGSEQIHSDPLRNPTIVDSFNIDEPLNDKLNTIRTALQNESTTLTFAYVPVVDTMGHKYGNLIDSGHSKVLKEVDDFLEQLFADVDENVNILVISDHGMSTILKENVYVWETLFGDLSTIPAIVKLYDDANTLIYTNQEDMETAYKQLDPHIPEQCELVRSTDIFPDVSNEIIHERIPQLLITCEPGYQIVRQSKYDKLPKRFGTHGFRKDHPDMRSLFLGKGPFFADLRSNLNDQYIKPFDNIQIFSLLLQLCGTDDIDVNVDADLKFWKHLIPLGKFSEVSKSMWENYPDSEFNKLWNNYIEETISEKPSATTSSIATSTISPTSSTIHDSTPTSERHPSLGEIIDEVEDTINDILHKIWPSNDKGND